MAYESFHHTRTTASYNFKRIMSVVKRASNISRESLFQINIPIRFVAADGADLPSLPPTFVAIVFAFLRF
jgi:hypothetical protein